MTKRGRWIKNPFLRVKISGPSFAQRADGFEPPRLDHHQEYIWVEDEPDETWTKTECLEWALGKTFPNGIPKGMARKAIMRDLEALYKQKNWALPKGTDMKTLQRARRKLRKA